MSFSSQPQVLQTRHSSYSADIALALGFSIVSITASPHCSPSLQQGLSPQSSYLEGQAHPSLHAQHLSSALHLEPLQEGKCSGASYVNKCAQQYVLFPKDMFLANPGTKASSLKQLEAGNITNLYSTKFGSKAPHPSLLLAA